MNPSPPPQTKLVGDAPGPTRLKLGDGDILKLVSLLGMDVSKSW